MSHESWTKTERNGTADLRNRSALGRCRIRPRSSRSSWVLAGHIPAYRQNGYLIHLRAFLMHWLDIWVGWDVICDHGARSGVRCASRAWADESVRSFLTSAAMATPTTRDVSRSRGPVSSSMSPSLVHIDGSNLCAVIAPGINTSNRMTVIWRRGEAGVGRLLRNPPPVSSPPGTPAAHESTCRFPYEIAMMIIVHLAYDLEALKACSLTCRSLYTAAVAYLHYTLCLREGGSSTARDKLKPLSKLHGLRLIPLVKQIRVSQLVYHGDRAWFVPRAFSQRDLRYFSAFTNVHTFDFFQLDISRFLPGVKRYFGRFFPTLRSIALYEPCCTPRQLSYFLSLFSNLDDIGISGIRVDLSSTTILDTELVPFSTQKPQGRLTLYKFPWVESWTDLITSSGGLRFHYVDLHRAGASVPVLLEACAGTLETLRFYTTDASIGKWFSSSPPMHPS